MHSVRWLWWWSLGFDVSLENTPPLPPPPPPGVERELLVMVLVLVVSSVGSGESSPRVRTHSFAKVGKTGGKGEGRERGSRPAGLRK